VVSIIAVAARVACRAKGLACGFYSNHALGAEESKSGGGRTPPTRPPTADRAVHAGGTSASTSVSSDSSALTAICQKPLRAASLAARLIDGAGNFRADVASDCLMRPHEHARSRRSQQRGVSSVLRGGRQRDTARLMRFVLTRRAISVIATMGRGAGILAVGEIAGKPYDLVLMESDTQLDGMETTKSIRAAEACTARRDPDPSP